MHVSRAAYAPTFRPFFGDEGAAHGPFAADTDAREKAEDGELPDVHDEGAQQGERGVPEDREHQRAHAAEFICYRTPDESQPPAD